MLQTSCCGASLSEDCGSVFFASEMVASSVVVVVLDDSSAGLGVQAVTRPSEFVVARNDVLVLAALDGGNGVRRVSFVRISAAGRPATVSSTWQVMKGRGCCAIMGG